MTKAQRRIVNWLSTDNGYGTKVARYKDGMLRYGRDDCIKVQLRSLEALKDMKVIKVSKHWDSVQLKASMLKDPDYFDDLRALMK